MTPVLPAIDVACPDWCVSCDTEVFTDEQMTVGHYSGPTTVALSLGPVADSKGDLNMTLCVYNGESPIVSMRRDEMLAEMTIEEAEQAAAALTTMVTAARAGKFRYKHGLSRAS